MKKQSIGYHHLPTYLRVFAIMVTFFSCLVVFVSAAKMDGYYHDRRLQTTATTRKTTSSSSLALRFHPLLNNDKWMLMLRGGSIGGFGNNGGRGGGGGSSSSSKMKSNNDSQQQQQQQQQQGYNDVEASSGGNEDEDIMEGQYSTIQPAKSSGSSNNLATKFKNVQERTGPAILMVAGVALWSYYLKEDGLILLTFLLQIGMYNEMTFVIGGEFTSLANKWWWFLTSFVGFNLPRMFPWRTTEIMTLTYGMSVLGILGSIIRFNATKSSVDEFREYLRQAAVSFLSTLLVVAPTSFWISTLEEFGMNWIIYSIALVIINDTMAYVFGMSLGKHPMLPSISPKKTWEGFVGAAISTIVVAIHWLPFKNMQLTKKDALIISGFVSLIAPFGGYLASVIKRAYGQKDFGNFIPGHGGFVDRLDCQVFMAPFLYLYLAITRNEGKSVEDLLTQMADKIIP